MVDGDLLSTSVIRHPRLHSLYRGDCMRFINMYLVGYFVLLIGALAASGTAASSVTCPGLGRRSAW